MKILLIVGSYPPKKCGIGDYASVLKVALEEQGAIVEVLSDIDWSLSNILHILKKIKSYSADIIHIQYPAVGFKSSLVPQIISLLYPTIVTIHEVSQAFWLRKLSLLPFSIRAKLIFTTDFEYKYFKKVFVWVKENHLIIPIGSNIPISEKISLNDRNINSIVYFGLIRPDKGLEKVIELAAFIKQQHLFLQVVVVGQVPVQFKSYVDRLKSESLELPVMWEIDLNPNDVSVILGKNLFAYLPFPDGISERRGSALAALANDMIIFTTDGEFTTEALRQSVIIVKKTEEIIEHIVNSSLKEKEAKLECIKKYSSHIDWSHIANTHIKYYNS